MPNSWLKNIMMRNLIKFILVNTEIDFIVMDSSNIFENTSVGTTIFKLSFKSNNLIDMDFTISHQVSKYGFLKTMVLYLISMLQVALKIF